MNFQAGKSSGPSFACTISAFNRILDFSNGPDFYLGFFDIYMALDTLPGHPPSTFPPNHAGFYNFFCISFIDFAVLCGFVSTFP